MEYQQYGSRLRAVTHYTQVNLIGSGVLTKLELLQRSKVLFPSPLLSSFLFLFFILLLFPPSLLPFTPLLPSLSSLEVGLWPLCVHPIYQAFHFNNIWGNATVYHRPPCPGIIWGNGVPKKYLGERRSLAFPSTTPLKIGPSATLSYIFTRQRGICSHRMPVRLSFTSRYCIKTAKRRISENTIPKISMKFRRKHPQQGCQMHVG